MVEYNKVFKGEVKVSDIQEAFNNIVNRINNMISVYNSSEYISHIDYSVGGESIAPAGYTLTIGGLKKILETYKNCVIGSKCFKTGDNKVVITDGILITKEGGVRLPSEEIIVGSNNTIYYDKSSKQYVTNKTENTVKICNINMKSDSEYVQTHKGVLSEDFDGSYKVTIPNTIFSTVRHGSPIYPNTSKEPKFVSALDGEMTRDKGQAHIELFGEDVAWNEHPSGISTLNYWVPMNFLFLPKGVNNPYNVTNYDSTKTYNVKINKKVE